GPPWRWPCSPGCSSPSGSTPRTGPSFTACGRDMLARPRRRPCDRMLVERLREISKDLTARRVYDAVERRVLDLPHLIAWHRPGPERDRNLAKLARFAGRHAGQRCFIIGNGPSLAKMDLGPLRGEVTFGMNRIYLLRDKIGFLPTYFACSN